ncbi:hypothetical protein C7B76_30385, partial [filamentous cyanobacterium CCP2]
MAEVSLDGIGYITAGTGLGTFTAVTIGNIGLVGQFGGIGIGAVPIAGAGAIVGAAIYGSTQAIHEGDPMAFAAIGLGMVVGATASATIGGIG